MAVVIVWVVPKFALPLLEREFWSATATVITIAAVVWILILFNGVIETFLRRRMVRFRPNGTTSLLRLGRRTLDLLLLFAGLLTGLHHFGVNLTAALAGLGVGGIAVALAAQRTLENVIGGISIIFDQVVHVGDRVKVVNHEGFVEDIGLRSTRIRTLDRTVLTVPNGQLATVSLENISIATSSGSTIFCDSAMKRRPRRCAPYSMVSRCSCRTIRVSNTAPIGCAS